MFFMLMDCMYPLDKVMVKKFLEDNKIPLVMDHIFQ